MITINNWSIKQRRGNSPDPYKAPEQLLFPCLSGIVENHPRFPPNSSIYTSRIIKVEIKKGEKIITTQSGSQYKLGTVNPDYEKLYPNAKERIQIIGE